MNPTASPTISEMQGFAQRCIVPVLSNKAFHVAIGLATLMLDMLTDASLRLSLLFVIPVTLSSWYCQSRLSNWLALMLPLGKFFIETYDEEGSLPFQYIAANAGIEISFLTFTACLVRRVERQTRQSRRENTMVTICSWSRMVEYRGEWILFEEYLLRRFNVSTSHGVSPAVAEKILHDLAEGNPDAGDNHLR